MKRYCVLGLALLSASVVPALATPLEPADILDAATGDFNKDGVQDLLLLTRGEEDMNVLFFLGDRERHYLKPAGEAIGKVWGRLGPDALYGQEPEITVLPSGSIQIITRNESIGRSRWTQTLTLAYRNTDFIVAGFTYKYYDTLDLNNIGDCDLNVLTGKGIANVPDGKGGSIKKQISVKPEFTPFKDWLDDSGMKACGIGE